MITKEDIVNGALIYIKRTPIHVGSQADIHNVLFYAFLRVYHSTDYLSLSGSKGLSIAILGLEKIVNARRLNINELNWYLRNARINNGIIPMLEDMFIKIWYAD